MYTERIKAEISQQVIRDGIEKDPRVCTDIALLCHGGNRISAGVSDSVIDESQIWPFVSLYSLA